MMSFISSEARIVQYIKVRLFVPSSYLCLTPTTISCNLHELAKLTILTTPKHPTRILITISTINISSHG